MDIGRFWRILVDFDGFWEICVDTVRFWCILGDLNFGAYMEKMNLDTQSLENLFHGSALSWLDLNLENFK